MKPLILLSSLGVFTLLSEVFKFKRYLYPLILVGLIATLGINYNLWSDTDTHQVEYGMMLFDNYAIGFTGVMLFVCILWLFMAQGMFNELNHIADYTSLILFSLCGALLMVSYSNLTLLFLGIEILSIPMYVMAGSRKDNLASNEAAFKYFLMGAFATGFLLFGIALIYGATGSFDIKSISHYVSVHQGTPSPLLLGGVLFMLIGMSFKVSAAPFHFWAPDVYQGSPTVVTAFMSTIVKTAAIAAFFRLFFHCFYSIHPQWSKILWMIIGLTLVIGNLGAVYQHNVKRMLAYSGVSHAGFMLIALLSANAFSKASILYYTLAYGIASIAVFTVLINVSAKKGSEEVNAFNGLARRHPLLALALTIGLLSLAGIPPMSGFYAKYSILFTALKNNQTGIVVLAILTSLIGVDSSFKVIIAMYLHDEDSPAQAPIELKPTHKLVLLISCVLIIALGIFPDYIIQLL
jgi:NADH-quinone oxidoreductase subunit N